MDAKVSKEHSDKAKPHNVTNMYQYFAKCLLKQVFLGYAASANRNQHVSPPEHQTLLISCS